MVGRGAPRAGLHSDVEGLWPPARRCRRLCLSLQGPAPSVPSAEEQRCYVGGEVGVVEMTESPASQAAGSGVA